MKTDKNFDSLIDAFEKRIYQNTAKGDWRLKLLKEDLALLQQQKPLKIWDAGCGFGQLAAWFAEQNHQLTLCDLSEKMLQRAQSHFAEQNLNATFLQGAAQQIATQLPQQDLVIFHAVLEWLAEPKESLEQICHKVADNGHLSLMFYNRNAAVYTNTLKGAWRLKPMLDDSYIGKGKRLTPPNPQYPDEVQTWLKNWGFEVKTFTGIRVFHDYMTPDALAKTNLEELFELEYRHCRQPTFREMGRYIHILAKKITHPEVL